MKEIEKKDTPEISGGYRPGDSGGGCIPIGPLPVGPLPIGEPVPDLGYPQCPVAPYNPETQISDPPSV